MVRYRERECCYGTVADVHPILVDLRDLDERRLRAWRVLLAADVLRRVLEVFHGSPVRLVVVEDENQASVSSAALAGLGIGEIAARVSSSAAAQDAIGGVPALVVEPVRLRPDMLEVPVSRVVQIGVATPPAHRVDSLDAVLGQQYDPAALRLALQRFPPASPAEVSEARLRRADETIGRWRFKVAMWAEMPSAAPVAEVVDAARASLEASLDTAKVVRDLHRLEIAPRLASGSKFETFAYLDRLLGLDLCHLVGKLHR